MCPNPFLRYNGLICLSKQELMLTMSLAVICLIQEKKRNDKYELWAYIILNCILDSFSAYKKKHWTFFFYSSINLVYFNKIFVLYVYTNTIRVYVYKYRESINNFYVEIVVFISEPFKFLSCHCGTYAENFVFFCVFF